MQAKQDEEKIQRYKAALKESLKITKQSPVQQPVKKGILKKPKISENKQQSARQQASDIPHFLSESLQFQQSSSPSKIQPAQQAKNSLLEDLEQELSNLSHFSPPPKQNVTPQKPQPQITKKETPALFNAPSLITDTSVQLHFEEPALLPPIPDDEIKVPPRVNSDRVTIPSITNDLLNRLEELEEANSKEELQIEEEIDTEKESYLSDCPPALNLQNKILEAEIHTINERSASVREQLAAVQLSVNRIQDEIDITEEYKKTEQGRMASMNQLFEEFRAEMMLENDGDIEVDDSESESSLAVKLLQLDTELTDTLSELKSTLDERYNLEERRRRNHLKAAHFVEVAKQKLKFEKRWLDEVLQSESSITRQVNDMDHDIALLEADKKILHQKNEHELSKEQFYNKAIHKVVNMLRGKTELPSGHYINVTRAIELYSELQELVASSAFSIETMKKFIENHTEFGLIPLLDN